MDIGLQDLLPCRHSDENRNPVALKLVGGSPTPSYFLLTA